MNSPVTKPNALTNILILLGLTGSLVSTLAVFSGQHLFFDWLSPFRIQYIVLIAGLLLLTLLQRKWRITAILLTCLLVHLYAVWNSQFPNKRWSTSAGPSINVMTINLLAGNQQYTEQAALINRVRPDLIAFLEYTSAWDSKLSTKLTDYPYKLVEVHDSPFGIALYSKQPLTDGLIKRYGVSGKPSIRANVTLGNSWVTVIATHPPPPLSQALYAERNLHLQQLAKDSQSASLPVIVLADLNLTPWSAHFTALLRSGNLSDARSGFGILPTWPTTFSPLQIPIDFILHSPQLAPLDVSTNKSPGSDHKSIWATLTLQQ